MHFRQGKMNDGRPSKRKMSGSFYKVLKTTFYNDTKLKSEIIFLLFCLVFSESVQEIKHIQSSLIRGSVEWM